MKVENKTVFVGLSGGVDSSVAALRLKNQGYNVVGVFIKVWHPEWLVCNWEEERLDAMRVAAKLDIPFLTCDAEQAYKDGVAVYFIAEYKAGRTPNPDVLCNKEVKFGVFLDFATKKGADFVATGHYAQKITPATDSTSQTSITSHKLHRGVDEKKDQTYFLWTLTQRQLDRILFPVGDTPKENIRKEADAAGLITSTKKDSQGICFLGHIDIKEFLSHYIELTPGDVLNEKDEVIGSHDGSVIYTIGQRHGFTIHNASPESHAHFVTKKNIEQNTITVSTQAPKVSAENSLELHSCNWIGDAPNIGDKIEVQIRYRQTPFFVTVKEIEDKTAVLVPEGDLEAFAQGQSAVCYQGAVCLGGGIIA